MAKETTTKLIDDLDGGEATETVSFGLDGHSYEIDLSAKNATKMRNALALFVEKAHRLRGVAPSRAAARRVSVERRDENQAIREWALKKGLPISPRGRIKEEIVTAYHERPVRGRSRAAA